MSIPSRPIISPSQLVLDFSSLKNYFHCCDFANCKVLDVILVLDDILVLGVISALYSILVLDFDS